jgi:hypothetical protein
MWSPFLREEHRMRVFEKWALRRMYGPKREDTNRSTEKTV